MSAASGATRRRQQAAGGPHAAATWPFSSLITVTHLKLNANTTAGGGKRQVYVSASLLCCSLRPLTTWHQCKNSSIPPVPAAALTGAKGVEYAHRLGKGGVGHRGVDQLACSQQSSAMIKSAARRGTKCWRLWCKAAVS